MDGRQVVGVALVVVGILVAAPGALLGSIHLGGSANGGGSSAGGSLSFDFSGLLWFGLVLLVLGVVLVAMPRQKSPGTGQS